MTFGTRPETETPCSMQHKPRPWRKEGRVYNKGSCNEINNTRKSKGVSSIDHSAPRLRRGTVNNSNIFLKKIEKEEANKLLIKKVFIYRSVNLVVGRGNPLNFFFSIPTVLLYVRACCPLSSALPAATGKLITFFGSGLDLLDPNNPGNEAVSVFLSFDCLFFLVGLLRTAVSHCSSLHAKYVFPSPSKENTRKSKVAEKPWTCVFRFVSLPFLPRAKCKHPIFPIGFKGRYVLCAVKYFLSSLCAG